MFEWCEGSETLTPIVEYTLREAGAVAPHGSGWVALVVGCGTSSLSEDLRVLGAPRVHSVDVDVAAIDFMREKHKDDATLTWQVLDLTTSPHRGTLFSDNECLTDAAYSLAADKGTLDYFLCGESEVAVDAMANVHAALQDGGLLLLVSLHPLELMQSLFGGGLLGFEEVRSWSLSMAHNKEEPNDKAIARRDPLVSSSTATSSAMLLRRQAAPRPWSVAYRLDATRHVVTSLDDYFNACKPLLTPARELELRSAWGSALQQQHEGDRDSVQVSGCERLHLPVAIAHVVMFPKPSEREEYDLELFEEDLRASGIDLVQGLSLNGALEFLRSNQ